jgi:hypothetical protein
VTALQIQKVLDKVQQFQFFPARLSFRGERALAEMSSLQAAEDAFYARCTREAIEPRPLKKRIVATQGTRTSTRKAKQLTKEQRAAVVAMEKIRVQEANDKAEEEEQAHDTLKERASFAQHILKRERECLVLFSSSFLPVMTIGPCAALVTRKKARAKLLDKLQRFNEVAMQFNEGAGAYETQQPKSPFLKPTLQQLVSSFTSKCSHSLSSSPHRE